MNISTLSLQDQLHRSIEQRNRALASAQIQLSTGKKYIRRSENPAETSEAARIRAAQRVNQQWTRNVGRGMDWSRVTEGRLDEGIDIIQRTNELAVQSGDATMTAADRQRIATEVDAMLESMVAIANTTHQGSYLFGGIHSDSPPIQVTRDPSGQITSLTPAAVAWRERQAQVGDNEQLRYGATAGGPQGVFVDSASGIDVIQSMLDLRDQLLSGQAATPTDLTNMSASLDQLTSRLVESGVDMNRLEGLETQQTKRDLSFEERLSDVDDVDLAKALTNLSQLEISLQATLQVASRLNQISLIDFI